MQTFDQSIRDIGLDMIHRSIYDRKLIDFIKSAEAEKAIVFLLLIRNNINPNLIKFTFMYNLSCFILISKYVPINKEDYPVRLAFDSKEFLADPYIYYRLLAEGYPSSPEDFEKLVKKLKYADDAYVAKIKEILYDIMTKDSRNMEYYIRLIYKTFTDNGYNFIRELMDRGIQVSQEIADALDNPEIIDNDLVYIKDRMVSKTLDGRAKEDIYMNFPIGDEDDPDGYIMAVFDGHGSANITNENHPVSIIQENFERILNRYLGSVNYMQESEISEVEARMVEAFIEMDRLVCNGPLIYSGSTCNLIFVTKANIYAVNLGDSRSIIIRDNNILLSTEDHKPSTTNEMHRIQSVGGFVQSGRVNGVLATSRAFGDKSLKMIRRTLGTEIVEEYSPEGPVSAIPDVYHVPREPNTWVILGTDGLFDGFDNNQNLLNAIPLDYDNLPTDLDNTVTNLLSIARGKTNDDITCTIAIL